ncbi:hypothetical protein ACVW00_002527 [Marmoricola sp. URHA0025 HA25]
MDESDSGTIAEREERAAREWAEQQRAQARSQFATPSWIGPDRGTATPHQVPAQAEPEHDELEYVVPVRSGPPIPETAHWSETAKPRVVAGTLLVLALAGVVTSLVLTITSQSPVAIAGLAASAIVAVIFRGALMAAPITTVELKGSVLRIHRGGQLDVVNLADPMHLVDLIGDPEQPSWRLRLEAVDGRIVELGPKEVDPRELHRVVVHYRAIAERARREREERFKR